MNSTPVGTRVRNNRESMSNITINKLLLPNNLKLKKSHQNTQSQQILDQQLDENVFYIPKQTLRRVKYSEQNIMTNSTAGKSLQSQLIGKFLNENIIKFHQIKSRKQIAIKELVSSSKTYHAIKKEGNINTEPNQDKQTLPFMPQLKSSQVIDDLYKFTFYSPKTQENKLRLPKEFQIQPCSKKKYFI
ncbi:unnamed protein product [Paramecium pentaurelia]|uniref:Uncharacterized protein n=1 Tax=Paramecium pentaurelia TaxID=43138 RepID=A0A8S1TK37_9CILI|nr:unnamed protein product [Paramecium pentaurelia]